MLTWNFNYCTLIDQNLPSLPPPETVYFWEELIFFDFAPSCWVHTHLTFTLWFGKNCISTWEDVALYCHYVLICVCSKRENLWRENKRIFWRRGQIFYGVWFFFLHIKGLKTNCPIETYNGVQERQVRKEYCVGKIRCFEEHFSWREKNGKVKFGSKRMYRSFFFCVCVNKFPLTHS